MKKISMEVKNNVVVVVEKGYSSRKIMSSNSTFNYKKDERTDGRPRSLSYGGTSLMERMLRENKVKAPKAATMALNIINRSVSE